MKLKTAISAAFISILTLSGCGSEDGSGGTGSPKGSTNRKETYEHQYSLNGCDTGKHTFRSLEDYCDALKDEVLNKGYAIELRRQAYNSNCS